MVMPEWGKFQQSSNNEDNESDLTPLQNEEIKQEQENLPEPQWGGFKDTETYQGEADPTSDESTYGYIVRNLSANASRLAEISLGKYGDVEAVGKSILTNFPQSAGVLGHALSQWLGPERWKQLIEGKGQNLPTSSQLKELSETVTGGYTKPKTPGEEKFQEFTTDIGAIGSLRTGRIPTLRQGGIAGLANVGKVVAKDMGFNEDKSSYTKMGIWTALSLLDKVNAPRYAAEMTNNARRAFDPNLQANVPRYMNRLTQVQNNPTVLVSDPRTALARNQINTLQQNVANGQNSIESLMTAYDGVNAAKRSSGMFELTRPSDRRFATHALDNVLGAVRDEIREVGSSNPQALNLWQQSMGAWRAIHQSNSIRDWVGDLFRGQYAKLATSVAAPLFAGSAYGIYKEPVVGLTAAAIAAGGSKLFQVGYRVLNDPVLAEYYANALSAAARQDAPVFIKEYEKFNKKLQKNKSMVNILKPDQKEKASNTTKK